MAAGRKSRYETEVKDKLLLVQGWARSGLTEKQIAQNLGVGVSSFSAYKLKYPALVEALKKGKEVVDFEVENALLKRALGYEYEEVRETSSAGIVTEIVRTKKYMPPDVTAQIFWLKNRKPEEWREKRDKETNSGEGVNVSFNILPASQRPKETEEEKEE